MIPAYARVHVVGRASAIRLSTSPVAASTIAIAAVSRTPRRRRACPFAYARSPGCSPSASPRSRRRPRRRVEPRIDARRGSRPRSSRSARVDPGLPPARRHHDRESDERSEERQDGQARSFTRLLSNRDSPTVSTIRSTASAALRIASLTASPRAPRSGGRPRRREGSSCVT